MMMSSRDWFSDLSNNLGAYYPLQDGLLGDGVFFDVADSIAHRKANNIPIQLDPVALAVKTINPYLFGNRTLIQHLERTPWFSKRTEDGGWREESLPQHGNEMPAEDEFVQILRIALLDEARRYIGAAKSVGILLSGGMDSRVVAGIVREVQLASGNQFDVIGLTWGKESSRDVSYAKTIARRFGWEWKHFKLTPETLFKNISQMGRMGAEASPVHLHAMLEVASTPGIDVILAGSYGDSVGRAEFSGKHLKKLKPMALKLKDDFGLLRHDLFKSSLPHIKRDLVDNFHLQGEMPRIRRCEIEQQCHYMRRMLQYCMSSISLKIPLYQMFTSPQVFGLMWGLSPDVRDNRWYRLLLGALPGELLEIPWARTGLPYECERGSVPDDLNPRYHEYGLWLRDDLRDLIVSRVNSDRIRKIGFLNDSAVDRALKAWERSRTTTISYLDETFSWLASLHEFLAFYELDVKDEVSASCLKDTLSSFSGGMKAHVFVQARNWLRR